jgi:spore germination protein Q
MSNENRQTPQSPNGGGMQGFPFLGMQQQGGQMPNMGMQQGPGMGMQQMPNMGGQQMPSMGMPQGSGMQQGLVTPSLPPFPSATDQLPVEQSYIENILRLNKGKVATVYMTFEGGKRQSFTGIIEAAGRDHIILSDPDTGMRYLLLMVYVDYITFSEEIQYSYPFAQMGTYSPR